jgi:hypothetical protein
MEKVEHYQAERNHQGRDNRPIFRVAGHPDDGSRHAIRGWRLAQFFSAGGVIGRLAEKWNITGIVAGRFEVGTPGFSD